MAISDEVIFTRIYQRVDEFEPIDGSGYVYAQSIEERSGHIAVWKEARGDVVLAELSEHDLTSVRVIVGESDGVIALRSERQLASLWLKFAGRLVYLDITGLSHHVWAALVRSAIKSKANVRVVYVEPRNYKFSSAPTEGQIFDLSEKIAGIAPLPGFATLASTRSRSKDSWLIPLLGFEGTRFAYVIEQVQPGSDRIIPIVGVPGFRPEYPFHTYVGNKRALIETAAWHRVEYAAANCPFGVFYLLERLASELPGALLLIATIGTKPHALGAVLFKVLSNYQVELVYDHPIRKPERTSGSDRLLVYDIAALSDLKGSVA